MRRLIMGWIFGGLVTMAFWVPGAGPALVCVSLAEVEWHASVTGAQCVCDT